MTPNTDAEWDDNLSIDENLAAMGDNLLDVMGKGSFTNYGTIDSVATVLDGEFIAQNNSSKGDLCLGFWFEDEDYVDTMSTLRVNGSVAMTGLLESYFIAKSFSQWTQLSICRVTKSCSMAARWCCCTMVN